MLVWPLRLTLGKHLARTKFTFNSPLTSRSYPVELLRLLLQCLLFELLDEVDLLEEPDLTATQAFQVAADMAVDLRLDLCGNRDHLWTVRPMAEQPRGLQNWVCHQSVVFLEQFIAQNLTAITHSTA